MVQGDFESHLFVGLKVKQVRLVRDRQTDRFRGNFIDFQVEERVRLYLGYQLLDINCFYWISRFCLCGFRRCSIITSCY
jgi:hypothetical protein